MLARLMTYIEGTKDGPCKFRFRLQDQPIYTDLKILIFFLHQHGIH